MITMPESGWAFHFDRSFGSTVFLRFLVRTWIQIRGARFITVGALTLFACVAMAAARQTSTGDDAGKKPETMKTTTHTHHKTVAKAPASSSVTKSNSTAAKSTGKRASRKKSARVRGQQKIDSARAQAI